MTKTAKIARDLYQEVTDRICADLERGVATWTRPWSTLSGVNVGSITIPRNAVSGRKYSGMNVLLLWCTATSQGYEHPCWLTFKQAKELGGHVRKGERGTTVVYYRTITRTETDQNGEEQERAFPLLRAYTVFNVAQCNGLPERFYQQVQALPETIRDQRAEAFIRATGAEVRHGGDKAYYTTGGDYVQLPHLEQFQNPAHYYSTAMHELGHWTGNQKRLDRQFGRRFGDMAYAAEELVAELTSAFLCAELQIEGRLQHSEYLASWLRVLKSDKRAIFTAASKASAAAEFLIEQAGGIPSAEELDDVDPEPVNDTPEPELPVVEPEKPSKPVRKLKATKYLTSRERMLKATGMGDKWGYWKEHVMPHRRALGASMAGIPMAGEHCSSELSKYAAFLARRDGFDISKAEHVRVRAHRRMVDFYDGHGHEICSIRLPDHAFGEKPTKPEPLPIAA